MKNRFCNKGLTLIEIIVALAILAIIVVGFSPLFSTGVSEIFKSGHRSKALYEAQKEMDTSIQAGTTISEVPPLSVQFPGLSSITIEGKRENKVITYQGRNVSITAFIPKS